VAEAEPRWLGAATVNATAEPREPSGTEELADFAERLLAVIDDGRRTATYKLAVLMALMDCCAAGVSDRGRAPALIPTRTIARRVAELYWPQLRPFPTADGAIDLRQITMKSSKVISTLHTAFAALPAVPTWQQAEDRLPAGHVTQVLDVVEVTVAREPLLRLQTVDGVSQPFIYDTEWDERITIRRLHADGGAAIHLRPGAGDQLIRLAPLLRPLIELQWVKMVARLNRLGLMDDYLQRHLFGAARVAFPTALRAGLAELQEGQCFYCENRLTLSTAVDHFLPWSRWPNDAIENLVIAHPSCNNHKSDRIPGPTPLARWAGRMTDQRSDLATMAVDTSWRSDPDRTVSLARGLYAHLPEGAPVWNAPHRVGRAHRDELLAMLVSL
jgi:hypothetical protein